MFSLDVFDETGETRCNQMEQLHEEAMGCGLDDVVCLGDFNSILRTDYDEKHWQWILHQDDKRGVKTVTNAMDLILHKYNWRDSFDEAIAFQSQKKTDYKPPPVTTWTMRRVDFVLLSPRFTLPIINAFVLYNTASDHLPVGIDIDCS